MKPKKVAVFYILLDIFITRLSSKILRGIFWHLVHRCKQCADIWKVTSSSRAEIEIFTDF